MKKRLRQGRCKVSFIVLSIIFISYVAFNPLPSYSQQTVTVSGKVLDANSSPLQGVTVKQKSNPQVATMTDAEGNFKIPAKVGDVLTIQSVGYKDEDVNL